MTADEIRARIEEALYLAEPAGDWWLDEAVRRLEVYQTLILHKRAYDVSSVGARIRTAREILGLSQPALAKRMRVHGFAISDWERGNRDMPIKYLRGLCVCLGVSHAWLLGTSDEGGPPMPDGIRRKVNIPNYAHRSLRLKNRDKARAELERLRGLRAPKSG